ncbi:MAG: hypothetical protein ACM3PB_00200 [Betaproteobacteria bacterium]
MVLLLAFVVLAGVAPLAQAFDNVGFHRAVNFMAVYRFSGDVMRLDPSLDHATMDWYKWVYGNDWSWGDGLDQDLKVDYSQKYSVFRDKWMGGWIVDGGFSGDEPETPMAIRHFYDPVYEPRYLTDQMEWLAWIKKKNPEMDAITWALGSTENQYSFYNGKIYYALALASTDPEQYGNYGKAWRSVGETMHVMADLCNPAHVRNDGHMTGDPMEDRTGVLKVARYAIYPSAPLDYSCTIGDRDLQAVMKDVATWTNSHFFSDGTITLTGGKQANGEKAYPSPVRLGQPDKDGYYYTDYYGQKIKAYRMTITEKTGNGGSTLLVSYNIAGDAVTAQQSLVIPTAIRASEAVLDAFLPRFTVIVDSAAELGGTGTVTARIIHVPTAEWPFDLPIRNGAHVLVTNPGNGKHEDTAVTVSGSGTLNQFSVNVKNVADGDQVTVYYDFGGYTVYSDPVTIAAPTAATAKPTVAPTPKPAPTYTEVADLIIFTNDFTSQYVGYIAHRGVMYTTKYAFEGTSSSEADITGTITWDTAGVCGPPVTYDWSITTGRDAKYKSMIDLQAMVPTSASPGTYTWRVTVRDSLGHSCTKAYTFTVKA